MPSARMHGSGQPRAISGSVCYALTGACGSDNCSVHQSVSGIDCWGTARRRPAAEYWDFAINRSRPRVVTVSSAVNRVARFLWRVPDVAS